MNNREIERRRLLKTALAGGAAAAVGVPQHAPAQAPVAKPTAAPDAVLPGYAYLHPEEAAFVEALVDHMVPADALSPKGTDLGLNIYIDRALADGWGKGERMYQQGPWKQGVPSQGYQLPLTPAELYRAGIQATNEHSMQVYGKPFDKVSETQREDILQALSSGKLVFANGPPARTFFGGRVSNRHGRHVRRSNLRRQSRYGRLEDARLSRGGREAPAEHRRVQEQALPWRALWHC
jgi:gluconate 2-dehydrogenase gamma chain